MIKLLPLKQIRINMSIRRFIYSLRGIDINQTQLWLIALGFIRRCIVAQSRVRMLSLIITKTTAINIFDWHYRLLRLNNISLLSCQLIYKHVIIFLYLSWIKWWLLVHLIKSWDVLRACHKAAISLIKVWVRYIVMWSIINLVIIIILANLISRKNSWLIRRVH